MKTRITELLGIETPILLGGLQWISLAEFVASVSNAGGAGFIPAATLGCADALRTEIRKAKELTDKPFGINISMLPDANAGGLEWIIEVLLSEQIPFVETSGKLVPELISVLKEHRIRIVHKLTSPKHAISAEKAGVDAVVLVGYEGGGHPGMDQVGTFVNLPKTVESVSIPVIAAGGICDGKSMAAALSLGAEGVMMGTRFVATKECPVHENYKQWILNADITDTLIIQRSIRNAFRAIHNEKAQQVLGLEQTGISLKELLPHISGKRGLQAIENGDMHSAVLTAGQCAGRIQEILSVEELMRQMISGCSQAMLQAQSILES